MNSVLGDPFLLALAALLGLVIVVFVLAARYRKIWYLYAAISAVSPMPIALPSTPGQLFAMGTLARTLRSASRALRSLVPAAMFGLAISYALAAIWSSNKVAAFAATGTALATFAAVVLAYMAATDRAGLESLLRRTLWLYSPMVAAQSIATIIFRVDPGVELGWFRSPIFYFLTGNEGRLLLTVSRNNVTDPDKAGGLLFVNANKASAVMAFLALAYLAMAIRKWSLVFLATAVTAMTATIMTGSKTAIILAITLPFVFLMLPLVLRANKSPTGLALGLSVVVPVGVAAMVLSESVVESLSGVDRSAGDREELWGAAEGFFQGNQILGLGFGGWAKAWAAVASQSLVSPQAQPHNLFIWNWANAGILAVICIVTIYVKTGIDYGRLIAQSRSFRESVAFSAELCAVAWVALHAMFDNTELFGTSHTLPIFAIFIARSVFLKQENSVSLPPGTSDHPSQIERAGSTNLFRRIAANTKI